MTSLFEQKIIYGTAINMSDFTRFELTPILIQYMYIGMSFTVIYV